MNIGKIFFERHAKGYVEISLLVNNQLIVRTRRPERIAKKARSMCLDGIQLEGKFKFDFPINVAVLHEAVNFDFEHPTLALTIIASCTFIRFGKEHRLD